MNFYDRLKKITTFCFDVDGVLTNSELIIADDGKLWRTMNARDGIALVMAKKAGFNLCIISGGRNEKVRDRLKGLGINHIYLGAFNKVQVLENYVTEQKLTYEEILFMGDDLNDYQVIQKVGLAACPANAAAEIKSVANYISYQKGGEGCVRDIIEKTLRLNDKWFYEPPKI